MHDIAYKAAGVVVHAYGRVDGKGVALVWRVESVAEAREHIAKLLFSKHGLMTVELTEIAEL
jgi:phosphoribosylamine-glycine ligase